MKLRMAALVVATTAAALLAGCGGGGGGTDGGAGGGAGGGSAGGGGGGGGGAGGGGGGGGGGSNCNNACTGTQVCNTTTGLCETPTTCTPACTAPQVCNTATNTCVQCLDSSQCSGSTPACNPNTNTCESNDTCASPQIITLNGAGATQTVTATLSTATPEEDTSCGPATATTPDTGDVTFRIDVSGADVDLEIKATPPADEDPLIAVRTGTCAGGTEVECKDSGGDGEEEIVTIRRASGQYFVVLKKFAGGTGTTTLTAKLTQAAPVPANDTCATAQALTFTNNTVTVTGTNAGATNNNVSQLSADSPTCTSSAKDAPDVIYTFTAPAGTAKNARVVVTPTSTSTLDPAVYIRRGSANCDSEVAANEIACETSGDAATFTTVPGEQYFIWVDGYLNTEGAFDLTVTLTDPPANDSCAAPQTLTFTNNTATVSFDLAPAGDNETGTCSSTSRSTQDLVYAIDVGSTPMDLSITLAPQAGNTSTDSVFYVRSGTCTGGAEQACVDREFDDTAETGAVRAVTGMQYIIVEAYAGPGPMTLTINRTAPIPGDACGNATPVTLNSAGNGTATVNTSTVNDDYQAVCGGMTQGGDAVLAVTPPADRDFDIRASVNTLSDGGLSDAILSTSATPCNHDAILTCADGYDKNEITTIRRTDGGTYYVFVDSYDRRNGPLNLTFSSYPVTTPPTNEACGITDGGIPTLTVGTPANGTLLGASDNWRPDQTDGGSLGYGCVGGGAVDVFYNVTPTTGTSMTVTVTPTVTSGANLLQPAIVVLQGCLLSSVRQCGAAATPGTPATATVNITANQQYTIAVEGKNGSRGAFTIGVVTQ